MVFKCLFIVCAFLVWGGQDHPVPTSVCLLQRGFFSLSLFMLALGRACYLLWEEGWRGGRGGDWGGCGLFVCEDCSLLFTWIGLGPPRPPIAVSAHWFCVQVPAILWCNGGWPAPLWWQPYSWRIHMSASKAVSTLMRGNWLSFSG